jgi:hypothetical protein
VSKPSASPRPARFTTDAVLICSAFRRCFATDAARARVLCIDYRLAPEHPFPAAIEDAAAAYRWLIAEPSETTRPHAIGTGGGGGHAARIFDPARRYGSDNAMLSEIVGTKGANSYGRDYTRTWRPAQYGSRRRRLRSLPAVSRGKSA